ncbi:phosphatidylethanolamine-binding protein [Tricladium varicosporioides]|nr:phosphatidylethanolamine-binding protein [Hymenoscyphus varicosporioides]
MLFTSFALLFSATVALAQTPPGFSPNVTDHLEVKYGTKVVTPGIAMTKADTGKVPTVGTLDVALTGTYILVFLDVDVPGNLAGGAAGSRTTYLHGMITGYTSATTQTSGMYVLSSKDTGPASYAAPGPPAETPAHPHKYIELLYAQPAGFKVPSTQTSAISKRVGFNITTFAADASLGAPVRANYFTQVNGA